MLDNSKIRQEIKQRRLALSESTYHSLSLSCFDNLKTVLTQFNVQKIGIYISSKNEVDTKRIIEYLWQINKEVYVPKCLENYQMTFCKITSWKDVKTGKYGLLEPISISENNQLDIQIIPLIGYDMEGYRLGMGGGYYDRYIINHPTLCIGLAFSFQEVVFSRQKHDLKFDCIIHEKGIIKNN